MSNIKEFWDKYHKDNKTKKKKNLICTDCNSNRAEKRLIQTGVNGAVSAILCDMCWKDFFYEFCD